MLIVVNILKQRNCRAVTSSDVCIWRYEVINTLSPPNEDKEYGDSAWTQIGLCIKHHMDKK
jgi:hypothetical protein